MLKKVKNITGSLFKMVKILVGCPTADPYRYCTQQWIDAVKSLSYKGFDVLLVDNSSSKDYFNEFSKQVPMIKTERIENLRELVARDRNLIRDKILKENYDYFLSLEIDVIPPFDLIEKLLSHKKDIVSGVYYKDYEVNITKAGIPLRKAKTILPLLWKAVDSENVRQLTSKEVEGNKLLEVAISGLGCLLIHRSVLEKVKFRVNLKESSACDDVWFCHDAIKQGFKIYADTSVKCKHLLKGKKIKF